jgi:WD40 repeat protein
MERRALLNGMRNTCRPAGCLVIALLAGCASGGVQGLSEPETGAARAIVGQVTARDYAANVDVLALGYTDGSFEVRAPAPVHVLSRGRHEAHVLNLALSKDAARLATVAADGQVAISTLDDGSLRLLADLELQPTAGRSPQVGLAWDASGQRLALSSGKLVRVVDIERCETREIQLKAPATALAFSPDGRQLVAGGKSLQFMSLPELRVERELSLPAPANGAQSPHVSEVRFSPNGRALGVLFDGGVAFLDVASQRLDAAELDEMKPVGLRYASDGRVAVFGRRALYLGPPDPSAMAGRSHATRGEIDDVEFRRDGSLLLVGDGIEAELATLLE